MSNTFTFKSFALLCLSLLISTTVWGAATNDDLQDFIDNPSNLTRASDDVVVVDLSTFSATTRTKTLEIKTGNTYRFINGTLKRASSFNDALVHVAPNGTTASSVDISTDAIFDADHYTANVPVVYLEGNSSCMVSGGQVKGNQRSNSTGGITYGIDVSLESSSSFSMTDGSLDDGMVAVSSEYDKFRLTGGKLAWLVLHESAQVLVGNCHLSTINMEKHSKVLVGSAWQANTTVNVEDEESIGDVLFQGSTLGGGGVFIVYFLTADDLMLLSFNEIPEGSEVLFSERDNTISLRKNVYECDDLQRFINDGGCEGDGSGSNPYNYNLPCGGANIGCDVTFSKSNGNSGDDIQEFINGGGSCSGGNKEIKMDGGNIVIPKAHTLSLSNLDFRGSGDSYIYVSGTLVIDVYVNIYYLLHYVRVLDGGRVIWRGGYGYGSDVTEWFIHIYKGGALEYHDGTISGGKYGFINYGIAYIYGGSISGIVYGGYTYSGGTTYISGGTISGGYGNAGDTYITGGTISGGGSGYSGGTIWNDGNLYLGLGNYNIGDIYLTRNGRIYILGSLTIVIRIHINADDIVLNTPIVLGYNGYTLTADDLAKIQIILPDGYNWRYDSEKGGIVIYSTNGIVNIQMDEDSNSAKYYDISGRRLDEPHRGVTIRRSKSGKTTKQIVK